MSHINWGDTRSPTRKEKDLYRKWRRYLKDSRLSDKTIDKRAKEFAETHRKVPTNGK